MQQIDKVSNIVTLLQVYDSGGLLNDIVEQITQVPSRDPATLMVEFTETLELMATLGIEQVPQVLLTAPKDSQEYNLIMRTVILGLLVITLDITPDKNIQWWVTHMRQGSFIDPQDGVIH